MAAHLRLYWSVVVHAEFNCPKHALPVGFPAKHRVAGRLFVEYFQNRIREIAGDVLRAVFVPQFDHLFVTAGRIIQVRVSGPSRPQTFIVTGCAAHIQFARVPICDHIYGFDGGQGRAPFRFIVVDDVLQFTVGQGYVIVAVERAELGAGRDLIHDWVELILHMLVQAHVRFIVREHFVDADDKAFLIARILVHVLQLVADAFVYRRLDFCCPV